MIPKLIHQIWIQGYDQLSPKLRENHQRIIYNNPDYKVRLWDQNSILNLLKKYPAIYNLFINLDTISGLPSINASKSDIGRLVILKEFGGFYLDIDFECILDFNNINNKEFVVADSKYKLLNGSKIMPAYCSCFMGSIANHPIWNIILDKIPRSKNRDEIGVLLDNELKNTKYPFYVINNKLVSTHTTCSQSKTCFTQRSSSWFPGRSWIIIMLCHKWIIVLMLLLLIFIYLVYKYE